MSSDVEEQLQKAQADHERIAEKGQANHEKVAGLRELSAQMANKLAFVDRIDDDGMGQVSWRTHELGAVKEVLACRLLLSKELKEVVSLSAL